VLNLGGVGNITWIDATRGRDAEALFAALIGFDTGPGNGLLDDWMSAQMGLPMDKDGAVSAMGKVNEAVLAQLMANPYFARRPPKSLDRFAFSLAPLGAMNAQDGAATLTAFSAASVARALDQCPSRPKEIFVAGGGRHNPTMMRMLAVRTGAAVSPVDVLGWQGDALEAQAFAYFAVRCRLDLSITFPGTTGIAAPLAGGRIAKPA